jgi:hypothetical protein
VLDDFEARMEARDLIRKGFGRLSEQEQAIVVGRNVYREKWHVLGEDYGLSRERMRQIELKALRKARGHLAYQHKINFHSYVAPYRTTQQHVRYPIPEPPAWPFPTPWPKLVIEPPKVIEPPAPPAPPVWPVFAEQAMTPLKLDRVFILRP